MGQQADWRYCEKCHVLFYDGFPAKGRCPGGIAGIGGHTAQGYDFDLSYDLPESGTAQAAWRYCAKCGVMFYDGYSDKGSCAAGGGHQSQGFNFTLPHDIAATPNAQAAWRYCGACHSMYYDGYPAKGLCPATRTSNLQRGTFYLGHQASGFDFVLPHDLPAAPGDGYPTFSITGLVWVVGLDHQEAQTVEDFLDLVSAAIKKAPIPPPVDEIADAVTATLSLAKSYIKLMDDLGGSQGVDVQGVIGVNGVIVTPHVSGIYQEMIQGARTGVGIATVADFLIALASAVPAAGAGLGIQAVAAAFAAVAAGSPIGWAVAGAAGVAVNLLLPAPDPNEHGGIHADRTTAGAWEKFLLSQIPPGDMVSILSWLGLFSAQNGGDDTGDVFANRPKLGQWETWAILNNSDGTVSFKSLNGRYLTATNGGGPGSYCLVNATAIGPNEKFHLENLPGGHIALKTAAKGTYLSVQPGT
ncbi:MAG: hypothetical protein ABSH09_23905 [Bryobacteraceae bacterium]|jgi:hypothetical protein